MIKIKLVGNTYDGSEYKTEALETGANDAGYAHLINVDGTESPLTIPKSANADDLTWSIFHDIEILHTCEIEIDEEIWWGTELRPPLRMLRPGDTIYLDAGHIEWPTYGL